MSGFILLFYIACAPIDADADGYPTSTDCDDNNPAVHPGADELCDDTDNDCSGTINDAPVDGKTWYTDADADGYGDPSTALIACLPPDGEVEDATDCDDTNPLTNPDADELCDGIDNDCDGITDPPDSTDALTFYTDADADGYGSTPVTSCTLTDGIVDNSDDCDDTDPLTHPGAPETWYDGTDADCAGDSDFDADADGFEGEGGDDCDDTDPLTHPDAAEVCDDGIDNDCDGTAGPCVLSGSLSTTDADTRLLGHFLSYAGAAVDRAGDVDGDGIPELIIGADGINDLAGGAYIVSGTDTGDVDLLPSLTLSGPSGRNSTGTSVSAAGDIDGDGFDDVLVGANANNEAFLAYGPITASAALTGAGWTLTAAVSNPVTALTVTDLGDINADGLPDVGIGSPYDSEAGTETGAAYLLTSDALSAGGGDLDLDEADTIIYGTQQSQLLGYSLDGAGDVNGDGLDDVLVGAGGQSAQAYIFLGPITGILSPSDADIQLTGTSSSYAGRAVSTAGDTNGDGYDDVIVGAHYNNNGTGAAYLFRGPLTADRAFPDADALMTGEFMGDEGGSAVSDAGDIDNDGLGDLLVGSPGASGSAGKAYLISGTVSGTISLAAASAVFPGGSGNSFMGAALAGLGDINSDGFDDLLIGSPYASTYVGEAYLFLGTGL